MTKTPWIVIGVIACGLIADRPLLHAQAPSSPSTTSAAPSTAGGADEPWNRGVAPEVRDAAREVFLEGNRLFKIPLFAQAVEKYTEAIGKWGHPAFYFNLALAQLNLGQEVEAHKNLEQAMKYGAGPLGEDELREAKKQLLELERRLGRLRVSCPTAGAEITLDGATLFTGPGSREIWVKAQAHEITAKRRDYVTRVKKVTVAAGAVQALDLPLRKLIGDRPWAVWKPWAVVGTGAALAAAGGVIHAFSARDFRAYDSEFLKLSCAMAGCTDEAIDTERPGLRDELGRARSEQKLAVGGYIAGGAAMVAGAVLVFLNRPRVAEQEEEGPRGAGITIAPVVSGDSLGMLVTVSH